MVQSQNGRMALNAEALQRRSAGDSASRLGLRLAADYRRVFLVDSNDVRFYCGLVVEGGAR